MSMDKTTWSRVGALFDELAELPPDQRRGRLSRVENAEVRDWVERLLEAHDAPGESIVDRALDDVVGHMLDEESDTFRVMPDNLADREFGNWRTADEIGRGGMGVVMRGERADGQFEKQVAIKLLPPGPVGPERRDRFLGEIRALARLEHPNIARLIDGGISDDGFPYLVMELVDGVPIHAWCRQHRLGLRDRIRLFREVIDAVAFSHRHLIVHGDIKPSNVLVDPDGHVKLVDFGVATVLSEPGDNRDLPAGVRCSPAYAAPERLAGAPPAIPQDVYALGAVLCQLLTGRRIRDARQTTSLLLGQPASEPARAPSELAADDPEAEFPPHRLRGDLDAICRRALAQDPEQRFETANAFGADLDNWLGQRPVEAAAGGNLYRAGKWFRRHRGTAAWGLALVVALIGGTTAALWQAHRAEQAAEQARESALAADAARARAESALARADAINEFLVELFQADIPRVPEDEMPTTREVVETGIERARDPATGPPEVRASLLLTLGNVILHHLEPDRAEALLHDAGELLDRHGIDNPRILIDHALLRADIAMVRDQADKVADAADEAIELLRAHRPDSLELLEIMRLRAQAERRIGTLADARERFEHVYALTEGRDDADLLRLSLAQDLAAISGMEKDFEAALEQFEEVLRLKRARDDTIPNQLATTEFNIAYALVELGEFERARNRLQQTLEYLAEIDAPNPVRASALLATGEIHRLQGRLQPALEMYRQGAREWARVKDLDSIDDDYLIHYRTAIALATAGRVDTAAEHMQRAIERMENGDRHHPPQRIAGARAMLAELQCRDGKILSARSLLAAVDDQLDPVSSPELARARAECALADPEVDPDPALVPPAVIEEHARAPGRAIETARLELLRARLLARSGNPSLALELLESARSRLHRLPLDDNHPLAAELHGVREHLSAP